MINNFREEEIMHRIWYEFETNLRWAKRLDGRGGLVEHGRKFPTTYHEWTRPKLASRCHGMLLPRTTMTYGQRKNHQCWSIGHANQPLAFPSFSNASLSSSLPQARVNTMLFTARFFLSLSAARKLWQEAVDIRMSREFFHRPIVIEAFSSLLVSKSMYVSEKR